MKKFESQLKSLGIKLNLDMEIVESIKEYEKEHKNIGFLVTNEDKRKYKVFYESEPKRNKMFINIVLPNKTDRYIVQNGELTSFVHMKKDYEIEYKSDSDEEEDEEEEEDETEAYQEGEKENVFRVPSPYQTKKQHMKAVDEISETMDIEYLKDKYRPIQYDMTKAIIYDRMKYIQFDKVEKEEYDFLNNVRNPFIYLCKKNVEIKKGYQYDVNSHFGSILSNKDFYFPLRMGKPTLLKNIDEIDESQCGMYMLDVDYSNFPYMHNNNANKYYYSNYDVEMFKIANIPFALREPKTGENHNAIIYENSSLVSSKKLFAGIVEKLYKMKKNGNKISGQILRMLHGVMFERKFEKINMFDYKPEMSNRVVKFENGKLILLRENSKSIYKCGLGRIKGFIYSFIRLNFYKDYIMDRTYKIYRIYIDSVIIDEKLDDEEIGDELGLMKKECTYKNIVWNVVNKKPKV